MTSARTMSAGLSTVEALVATALLGLVATALAQGLVRATAARAQSARRMQATQHAMSIVEELRGGAREIASDDGGFESQWSHTAVPGTPGLSRFTVTVRWLDAGAGQVQLAGLAWRHPGAR